MKPRKCGNCRQPARMTVGLHAVCSVDCGVVLARKKQAVAARKAQRLADKAHRERKRAVEPISKVLARVQRDCNAYIHARDHGQACISCRKHCERMEAGHWKPVGRASSPARYHPDNLHIQCHPCNVHGGGGNHPGYLPALLEKIGPDRVAAIERLHNCTVKWNREALEQLGAWFRSEKRRLEKERNRSSV